ncbi:MAG: nucleoside recognition domain-containing protein, partial [Myxococcota bacterium]
VILFPDVPPTHPAMSAMILNMSANALGLGNAATPFGIRAMEELDKLNASKGTATNAMCLFLAINTSAVTLLPTGVIAIREALGSEMSAGILPTTLAATIFSTTTAILAAKLYQRFTPAPEPTDPDAVAAVQAEIESGNEDDDAYPLWASLLAMAGLLVLVGLSLQYGELIGIWVVPLLVVGFLTFGVVRGVAVYETFVQGAKEGWEVAVRIIPFLVTILAMVGMLRGSGAIDDFTQLVGGVTSAVGMPAEALPMALLRPLSGSGAYGVMMAILTEHGPDSYIGFLVSTLQGSTETTFYVIAVYFGAVGVQRVRHSLAAALTADVAGITGAVAATTLFFTLNDLW